MAGLPLSGQLSLSNIRTELGLDNTNFSIDQAENGSYVAINPCSQYRPSSPNPASISEWYGYNHRATCGSTEYQATISDSGVNANCNDSFSNTEALQNINVYFSNVIINIGTDPSINRLQIKNIEKFPAIRIEIKAQIGQSVGLIYVFEGNGASYVAWDLVPNTGIWGASDITKDNVYSISIWYNDGSGRSILNQRLLIINPPADGFYRNLPYYSSSLSTACTNTNFASEDLFFYYPFTVGAVVNKLVVLDPVPDGYYRMYYDPTKVYRVVNKQIASISSC